MDSWTLQGDSYSFLRSAPHNFSLCHRDGTPNHVEIFDIINTPSQRSAISETTCLCDIFGDDAEAASNQSRSTVANFTPQQPDVEGHTVASPLVDDPNDSSGSYHTAHSSSEGEEGLEDSSERQNCSQLQNLTQEPDLPGTTNSTHHHISPDLNSVSDRLLLEKKAPETISQGDAYLKKVFSKTECRNSTLDSEDRHSSLSHHTSTPESRNCVSSSSSTSLSSQPDFRQIHPEPGSICDQTPSLSPTLQSKYIITPSKFLPEVIVSSSDILSSPQPELSGRISVPDLFSRYSSPDLDDYSQTPERVSSLINDDEDINISTFQDTDLLPETIHSVSTPDRQYISPSPVTSLTPSPQPWRKSTSPEITLNSLSPSPIQLSPSLSDRTPARSTTPVFSSAPESRTSLHSPIVNHSLSPSPVITPALSSAPENRTSLPSPVVNHSLSPSPETTNGLSSAPESRISLHSPVVNHSLSPSPVITPALSSAPENRTSLPSPVVNHSLSPSPETTNALSSAPESRISLHSPIVNHSLSTSPETTSALSSASESRNLLHSPVVNHSLSSSPETTSELSSTPGSRIVLHSPVVNHSLSPSPETTTALSSVPGSRISLHSPVMNHSLSASPETTEFSCAPGSRISLHSPVVNHSLSPSPETTTALSSVPGSRILLASPVVNQSLSPSPETTTALSRVPGSRISLASPVVNQSLSPSPGTSPVFVCIDKTASPEKSFTPSLPEIENKFESPVLEHHSDLQDIHASPQFTKVTYCIVQPEVQFAPTFSQEPSLSVSPKPKDYCPIKDSPHNSCVSALVSEKQFEDRHKTPSQDSRNQSPLFEHCQSLSPHLSSRNLSPISPDFEQPSSETPSAENSIDPTFKGTSVGIKDLSTIDILKTEDSAKQQTANKLLTEDREIFVSDTGSVLPVAASNPPFPPGVIKTTETTNTKRELKSLDTLGLDLYIEKQQTDCNYTEGKADLKNLPAVVNCSFTNPILPTTINDEYKNISPVHRKTADSPVKTLENSQPLFANFSQSPKNNHIFNQNLTPKPFRRQLSSTVGSENKSNLKENMASHVKKRRTPSPPLTRFTPVHIIAPEKPYRQWQNRSLSPSQVTTSLPSANVKKAVTNTEIPHHDPVNHSHENWFRKGRQQEIERGLQLQERVIDQELRDCGMYRQRKKEEYLPEKGEGWCGDPSYREEQVELSFNAKNRKGPMSRSTVVTSRDTRPGLPTVHSYSESLLTRQSKQKQSLHRLSSQTDSKSGGLGRRLQPPINPHKSTTSGRVTTNRPGRSSSSSMGSELDETDHEVKWFTDVAFSSLSSPEVDYLDMYNSSHHSSTNVSQPSTQESPAGVTTPWLSYADFSGSSQMLDNDELALQQTVAYNSDRLDPSKCYELGNFECVDVAIEKEDSRRVRRGVPKRQIQLKRRDTTESKPDESSGNSSPGVPVMDIFCQDTQFREHCTLTSSQDSEPYEESPELDKDATKSKHKKSPSFGDSCSKTKIATCLIKSVLTKKMHSDELAGENESYNLDENIPTTKSKLSNSPRSDVQMLSSSLLSDTLEGRCGANMKEEAGRRKNFGGKFSQRPSSTNSNKSVTFSIADSEEAEADTRSAELPAEPKETSKEEVDDNSQTWKETEDDDPANSTAVDIGPVTEGLNSSYATMRNREQECENTQCHKQALQDVPSSYTLKSPSSLSLLSMEKKKASLNVCLTPEAENKFFTSDEKVEACDVGKVEEEEMDDKAKGPLHKVRDVRRLVKNTYNLSFKATSAIASDETNGSLNKDEIPKENSREVTRESQTSLEERHNEEFNEEANEYKKDILQQKEPSLYSHPMQIEYKAVCWKEDKNNIATDLKNMMESKQPMGETTSQNVNETTGDMNSIDKGKAGVFTEKQHISTHLHSDKPLLGSIPKMPSKEREVSTAIVLIRDNSRAKKSPSHDELPCTVPASSPGVTGTSGSSGHSVSMLLKEKGYQADIGAVVGEAQNAGVSKSVPSKHVNCLEIPLQTMTESHRERSFSSSSTTSEPKPVHSDSKITETKIVATETAASKPDPTNKIHHLPPKSTVEPHPTTKQAAKGDFEVVKSLDPTFPPRSPAVRRFKTQPIEVKSASKETNKQGTCTSALGSSRPQAIEVKSVAKNSQKPIVPPKPSCKFKYLDIQAGELQRLPPVSLKSHNEDRTQTIVVSSPTIYRKIPNDSTSNYTRKVAVSSVSSLKPPPSKPPLSNISTQASTTETDTVTDRQQPGPPPQTSRYTQRHPMLPPAPTTTSDPSISSSVHSDATVNQPEAPAPTGATQTNQTAVQDSNPLPHIRVPYPHEPATMGPSDAQPTIVSTAQDPGFIQQPYHRSLSNECSQRRDDLHFYASDDPPSYDERESFSPLRLPDLPPRSHRYQPSSRPPPCPCTSGCPSHPELPHPHNSPHNLTPPAPTHSPGHTVHYPVTQPPLRAHHSRPDPQSVTYQPSSPKASPLGPGPPQGLYQPLHQPTACPPHPSLMHAYSAERPLQPAQQMEPRRPPVHRSPQQPPAVMTGAPYPDPGHSHSPGLPHIDPHYLCGPQSLGPSYGSEYGGDSSSIYSDSNYGQSPRRVLMDPETGKYFYIEVPVQPLRKMLFDPETGQYVEVLIPQQAMTHSGLYPPSAPNYPPLHSTNMYAPAPQYMPYAAPPAQPQPPRYTEPSAAASMHLQGPGVSFRNPSGQVSKGESQGHPPVDPNYLEGMYYVPTGMNASPNTTPPDYYHKHPANLPPSGGKRS